MIFTLLIRYIKFWMEQVQKLQEKFLVEKKFIFNFDETSLQLEPKRMKVVSLKEVKPIVSEKNVEEHITLGINICRDGSILKPLLISKLKKGATTNLKNLSFKYIEYYSKSGWITKDIFEKYLLLYFLPEIIKKRKELKKKTHMCFFFLIIIIVDIIIN